MNVPETPQALLIAVIRRLLKEDDVRSEDNFVELGGNSLLALQVASTLESEARVKFDVTQLLGDRIGNIVFETLTRAPPVGGSTLGASRPA